MVPAPRPITVGNPEPRPNTNVRPVNPEPRPNTNVEPVKESKPIHKKKKKHHHKKPKVKVPTGANNAIPPVDPKFEGTPIIAQPLPPVNPLQQQQAAPGQVSTTQPFEQQS